MLTLLVTVAALAAPAAVAAGGTVVKLEGSATVVRKGTKVAVRESSPVYSGDTLEVPDNAAAQVRFEDDSVFVVPGAAKLRVDQFVTPRGGQGGKAVYTLVDGGVRTITGRVSKNKSDQYELRTEEATITVAGSAYMAMRCQGACANKYKAGLYVRAESGTIIVTTAGGQKRIKRGQTVYVAGNAELPTQVKVSPFDDPIFGADFNLSVEFDAEVHPPRIEQEPPASPS